MGSEALSRPPFVRVSADFRGMSILNGVRSQASFHCGRLAFVSPLLVATLVSFGSASAQQTWSPMAGPSAPASAIGTNHPAYVWTGPPINRFLVWGGNNSSGMTNAGYSYDPQSDTWTPMTTVGAPSPRYYATAVWTGTEMIVWGGWGGGGSGALADGGRYDPIQDRWLPLSTFLAPSARQYHSAVWTGTQMFVWGGVGNGPNPVSTGGLYDPATDTWFVVTNSGAPSARILASIAWTGSKVLIWGGQTFGGLLNDGALYDPIQNSWQAMGGAAPAARTGGTAIWTGSTFLVWGGASALGFAPTLDTGGIYDPKSNSWTSTAMAGVPTARADHSSVWTGSRLVVWGGAYRDGLGADVFLDSGGIFDPAANVWSPTTRTGAPSPRIGAFAVWAETQMLVWSGYDLLVGYTTTGARWQAIPQGQVSLNTVTPCRILDTRISPNGPLAGPVLGPSERRTFDVSRGPCGIPASATAIIGNLTVTQPNAGGFFRIYSGNAGSATTSTVSFNSGGTRASSVIVRMATDGSGTIAIENVSGGTAHAILDVSGYFQ